MYVLLSLTLLFFFNDTATTEIYTLSLHDALPISDALLVLSLTVFICSTGWRGTSSASQAQAKGTRHRIAFKDRKSTRLNSSHGYISYAVFCLKKKKKQLICALLLHEVVHCRLCVI